MFGFKSKEQKEKELDEKIRERSQIIISKKEKELDEKAKALAEKILENQKEEEERKIKREEEIRQEIIRREDVILANRKERFSNAESPYLEICTSPDDFDDPNTQKLLEQGLFPITVDYNKTLIEMLKNQGFVGSTDEEIVHSYLQSVYAESSNIISSSEINE